MARRILGGAIVPAAPALLERVSPRPSESVGVALGTLRAAVRRTLTGLPEAEVVVLLDSGPRGIHQRVRADLGILGVGDARADMPVPAELVATATRITQYPLVGAETLPVSSAVLVLLVEEVLGTVPVLVATVPAKAEGEMLAHVGAGLVEAVRASDVTGVIVASGDLSAGLYEASPAHVVTGAAEWDAAATEAVAAEDVAALQRLGPERAREAAARSWAAMVAAHGAFSAARLAPGSVEYHAPLGVGQLTADFVQQSVSEPGGRFRRESGSP